MSFGAVERAVVRHGKASLLVAGWWVAALVPQMMVVTRGLRTKRTSGSRRPVIDRNRCFRVVLVALAASVGLINPSVLLTAS